MDISKIEWKKILTWIQVTSPFFHIWNYLAALKPLKELSKKNEVYLFIAEYHSLNSVQNKEEMETNRKNILVQLIAIFKDYPNIKIFQQSKINAIPHIALLIWSITPMGLMNRAHKVKEARDAGKDMTLGTYYYPALMAADILTFDADFVPVGKDQKQHLEFCRDMAITFNKTFGKGLLKLPEPIIDETIPLVPWIDGEKMSKSKNNYIGIFEDSAKIRKKIMKIITQDIPYADSKNPDECNVYGYIKLFATPEEDTYIRAKYLEGEFGYGDAKNYLADLLEKYFKKDKEEYEKLITNEDEFIKEMSKIVDNNNIMDSIASEKLLVLRTAVGLS